MASDFVEIRFTVPRVWRDELKVVAEANAISLADILRGLVRQFMRNRYTPEQQEALSA